jgi:hypothetical protein
MAGRRQALIIASDTYEQQALRDLVAPAADAEALGRVLGDPRIGDFAVQVVHNEPAHVIEAQIEEVFAESRPDDVLLLHFSGHGLKSESGELFFAASNTRLDRLGSTAVSAEFVQHCMRDSRSRSIVVLLDCCYGGAFAQGTRVRAAGNIGVLDSFPQGRSGGGRGRPVITASSAMEFAFEGDQLGDIHGRPSVFTNALVQGLATGDADRDEDGWVSLDELHDYVFDKVREQNPHQTPSRQFELEGELYLARSRRGRNLAGPIPADLQTAPVGPAARMGGSGRAGGSAAAAGRAAQLAANQPARVPSARRAPAASAPPAAPYRNARPPGPSAERPAIRSGAAVGGVALALLAGIAGLSSHHLQYPAPASGAFIFFEQAFYAVPVAVALAAVALRSYRPVLLVLRQGLWWPSAAWLACDLVVAAQHQGLTSSSAIAGNDLPAAADVLGMAAAVLLLAAGKSGAGRSSVRRRGVLPAVLVCCVTASQVTGLVVYQSAAFSPAAHRFLTQGIPAVAVGLGVSWYAMSVRAPAPGGAILLGWCTTTPVWLISTVLYVCKELDASLMTGPRISAALELVLLAVALILSVAYMRRRSGPDPDPRIR